MFSKLLLIQARSRSRMLRLARGVFIESSDLDIRLSTTGGVSGGTSDSFGCGSAIVTFTGLHARRP
jgi:hypothetical protein